MTDVRVLIAGAAVLIAACQPAQSAPAKAAPATATAAAATAAAAPSADAAKVWTLRMYAQYADDQFSPFATPENWFGADLVKELADNERLTPEGEQGAIDADPICSCQDPSGMTAKVTKATMTGPSTARVEVTLQWPLPADPIPSQIPEYTQKNVLILAMGPGGWRVQDIGEGESSFLKYMREANAAARAGRTNG